MYYSVVSLFVLNAKDWKVHRLLFLKRFLVLAHARHESSSPIEKYVVHVCTLDIALAAVSCINTCI